MEKHIVTIKNIEHVTHDTIRIETTKPEGYTFFAGQATDMAINKNGWQNEKRPFTFTSTPKDNHLEFIIKTYPSHDGATDKLLDLTAGDELILHEVFGSIRYKGEGLFIAGGAGMTPFLAILRDLKEKGVNDSNSMLFANKTESDIILKQELEELLNNRVFHILSEERSEKYPHGYITKDYLKDHIENLDQYFYVCGPMPMMDTVNKHLQELGITKEKIVVEGW